MNVFPVVAVVLLALTGCTAAPPPGASENKPSSNKPSSNKPSSARPELPPLPVLKVGEPAAIDLRGDGQATITITAAQLSKLDATSDRLVLTVDILLNKAGAPVKGGPDNFRFRDKSASMYRPQTSEQVFPPQLPSLDLTTTGQSAHGRLFFDVPAGSATGGHVQLMTGALVLAVWGV